MLLDTKLLVVALAGNASDGYGRFMKSAEHFGLDVKVRETRNKAQLPIRFRLYGQSM